MAFPPRQLNEAGVLVLDCEHKTPPTQLTGFPYITIPQLRDGRVYIKESRRISAADMEEWTRRTKPIAGDVIVTRRGRVGDTAPIPPDVDCAIGQNLVILRSDGSQVNQGYLRWAVRSPLWWSEVQRLMNVGAVFNSLNVRDIAKIRIPLPPLGVQISIASMLTALDDKIDSNRRLQATALELAEAQYIAECERDSRPVALKDAGRWLSGGTPSTSRSEYWGGDLPWISAASLKSIYVRNSERSLTSSGAKAATHIVPVGTVVFVVRGMSLKSEFRFGITQRDVAFGQDCKAIIPTIDPSVLTIALHANRSLILDLVDEAGHGTGRLATDRLERFQIEIPTAPTFAPLVGSLIAVGAGAAQESDTLASLRDALLPQLLSGRIRVPEAQEAVAEVSA